VTLHGGGDGGGGGGGGGGGVKRVSTTTTTAAATGVTAVVTNATGDTSVSDVYGIDPAKPLVPQVGFLGDRYMEWVHIPVRRCTSC
jgi:hypothetical protein